MSESRAEQDGRCILWTGLAVEDIEVVDLDRAVQTCEVGGSGSAAPELRLNEASMISAMAMAAFFNMVMIFSLSQCERLTVKS
jgi:hypothetical protein